MRRILSLGICLALASCSSTKTSGGQDLSVKFAQIEVGTAYVYRNTDNGLQWMRRYEGQEDGLHVMRSYFRHQSGAFTKYSRTDYFDAAGRRLRTDRESFDDTFVYAPFDCMTGFTGTCSHQRTLFDSSTGERKNSTIKHFEISRSGDTLNIVRNAQGNRLRRTQTLNEENVPISQREPNPQFADNWVLLRTVLPSR